MNIIQESYMPKVMTTSGAVVGGRGGLLGGFLCTTSGTLQLRDGDASGTVIVPSVAVSAGVYYPMPFGFSTGLYAELTGAQGTFGVLS